MTAWERRAWLENLDRLHAEDRLLFGEPIESEEQLYKLVLAATGDKEQARQVKMRAYRERINRERQERKF